jgi:N-acyl-D-aspartate/D-glutamate deacylase
MHDIVIRGGTIIDGTGDPAFSGDVAIDGGRLTAVGGKAGRRGATSMRTVCW